MSVLTRARDWLTAEDLSTASNPAPVHDGYRAMLKWWSGSEQKVMFRFYVCDQCGALIPEDELERHTNYEEAR